MQCAVQFSVHVPCATETVTFPGGTPSTPRPVLWLSCPPCDGGWRTMRILILCAGQSIMHHGAGAGQSTYIGGYDDLARLDESGELRQLAQPQQKTSQA